jgi:hypothetical protein
LRHQIFAQKGAFTRATGRRQKKPGGIIVQAFSDQTLRDGEGKAVASEYKAGALCHDLYPIIAETIIYGRKYN